MKRLLFLFLSLALLVSASQTPQEKYIKKFSATAVDEMKRTGVPASITMAQAMLESRNGESPLAIKANNHFGIKCHKDWDGEKYYQDDDSKGECFRVYASVAESFRDHSDFLRYRDRYKSLFDLKPSDYKAWAHGLKKAGYATDPKYASKLIKVIEDYKLYELDGDVKVEVGSPNSLEKPVSLDPGVKEQLGFSLTRKEIASGGVIFVRSIEGETYTSIAESYGLSVKEILRFNDLDSAGHLEPGTIVYLQMKNVRSPKGLEKYIVEKDGENLRDVSQRFAVRLKNLLKINKLSASAVLREGDTIKLR